MRLTIRRWVLCLAVAAATFVVAAPGFGQNDPLTIKKIVGLKTAKGAFDINPNELLRCHNVDLSREGVHTLSTRYGSVLSFDFPGADSVIGLGTLWFRDGTERMLAAVDSEGVGYANLYASALGTTNFGIGLDSLVIWIDTVSLRRFTERIKERDAIIADTSLMPVLLIDSFKFNSDTFVVIDTVCITSGCTDPQLDPLKMDSSIAARINAMAVLNARVVADSLPVGADTSYRVWVVVDSGLTYKRTCQLIETGAVGSVRGFTTTPRTGAQGLTPEDRAATHWSVQYPTRMTQFGEELYIHNGAQKALTYDGTTTSNWPPNAPGEVSVIPLDGVDSLDGEYRYQVRVYETKDTGDALDYAKSFVGYACPPVKVENGTVLLKDFPWHYSSWDSVRFAIYRTRANPGRLTEATVGFLVDTFWVAAADSAVLDTLTRIDLLGDLSIPMVAGDTVLMLDYNSVGRATDSAEVRFGAPILVHAVDSTLTTGVYDGAATTTIGVAYKVSYGDTTNLHMSDTGRALILYRAGTEDFYSIELPRPHGRSGTGRKMHLWRASVDVPGYDTTWDYPEWVGWTSSIGPPLLSPGLTVMPGDTLPGAFYLLAELDDTVTVYVDSLGMDLLGLTGATKVFSSNYPPFVLTMIETSQGRMFGAHGSTVWNTSRANDPDSWALYDFATFNRNDGDEGTAMLPFRGGMLFLKNYSAFNLLGGSWSVSEVAGVPGCVAPASAFTAHGINYYMSNIGVQKIGEPSVLARHHEPTLLSRDIDNLTKLNYSDLRRTVGAWVPQVEEIWFSVGDTTYCYDLLAQGWTTSSLTFGGTTLFDADETSEFGAGRTLYYYQRNSTAIYRFGEGSQEEEGWFIAMDVLTGPLFHDAKTYDLTSIGVWFKGTSSEIELIAADIWDETGATTVGTLPFFLVGVNDRHQTLELDVNPTLYYQLRMLTLPYVYPLRNRAVDRIDIYYELVEDEVLQTQ